MELIDAGSKIIKIDDDVGLFMVGEMKEDFPRVFLLLTLFR